MRGAGRDVWVKIRASEAERAEWHAKARSVGLTLTFPRGRRGGPHPRARHGLPVGQFGRRYAGGDHDGAAISDERTGDGVRGAPPPPARCSSSGAGSRGFEGGRSIPSPERNVQHCEGLALALATKGAPGRACGRLRTTAAVPSGAPGRLPVASTHRRRVSRRCGSPRSRALRSCCPSTTGIAWN